MAASLGIVCREDIYLPLVQGIVKYPKLVDVLHGPTLSTVYGHMIRSGTPYETLMGDLESHLKKEALWRAGRPGMACTGINGAWHRIWPPGWRSGGIWPGQYHAKLVPRGNESYLLQFPPCDHGIKRGT